MIPNRFTSNPARRVLPARRVRASATAAALSFALVLGAAPHSPSGALFAQGMQSYAARSGSIYSTIGIGLPADIGSVHAKGMGMGGVSFFDPGSPGLSNPAHWAMPAYTLGNLSLGLNHYRATDTFGSAANTLFSIDQFQFVAPLKKNRIGISISATPMTRVNYRVVREGEIDPFDTTLGFGVDDAGIGGVSRIEAGFGFKLGERLSLGYATSVLVASIQRETYIFFTSNGYLPVAYTETVSATSSGHRAGIHLDLPGVLGSKNRLAAGAAVQFPVVFEAEREKSGYKSVGGVVQKIDLETDDRLRSGTMEIPLEIQGGVTFSMRDHLHLSAEALMQEWGGASYTFDPRQQAAYADRVRLSAGIQVHPFRRTIRNSFLHNIKYSGGVSFDEGNLTLNDHRIRTVMAHAGFGLLNRRSASTIDLHVKVGQRGMTQDDLVREWIWGAGVSLNLAELMFIRPKFQ